MERATLGVPVVRDERGSQAWGHRLPLRGQSPASTERVKGAYGVAARSAAPTLDPLHSGLRAGSYEEGDSGKWARGERCQAPEAANAGAHSGLG
jgi:hypothetical protein